MTCGNLTYLLQTFHTKLSSIFLPTSVVVLVCLLLSHRLSCSPETTDWKGKERWVHELIRGAEIVIEHGRGFVDDGEDQPLSQSELDQRRAAKEEADRRKARLRHLYDDRQYGKMISDVAPFAHGSERPSAAKDIKQATENLFLAVNLIIAMVACFVVGFYLGGRIFRSQQASYICGVVGLVGAMFVEALLLVIQLSRQEDAIAAKAKRASALTGQRKALRPRVFEVPVPGSTKPSSSTISSKKTD